MFHVKQGWVAVTILMAAPAWAAGEAVRFPGPGLELAGLHGFDNPAKAVARATVYIESR